MAESQPITALDVGRQMQLGESPFWHPGEQRLYWCDITGRRVYSCDPSQQRRPLYWNFLSDTASCAPIQGGGHLLVAVRDGLRRVNTNHNAHSAKPRLADPPYDTREARWNDGNADPWGRFWVGTRTDDRTHTGGLYCYEGGRLDLRVDKAANSNGPVWDEDGTLMFWTDTADGTIYVFDYDGNTGTPSNRRPLISFPKKEAGQKLSDYGGRPDGMAVDATGRLVVAMYEGARVVVVDPGDASENAGQVVEEIRLPVQCPTAVAFGGPDLRTLFITTVSADRPEAELAAQPLAGYILRTEREVPGLSVNYVRLDQ